MKNEVICDICPNINNFNIKLVNINVKKDQDDINSPMKIAIGVDYQDFKKLSEGKYMFKVLISLIGLKNDANVKKESFDKDKDGYFIIEVLYNVFITFKNKFKFDLKDKLLGDKMKKYIWFIIYPTAKENIRDLGEKIDIPNLSIPYKAGLAANDNR